MNGFIIFIVLNWNGYRDTIECLESIFQIKYNKYQVVLVDNCSSDNSIEEIKDYCDGKSQVKSKYFIENKMNKPITLLEYSQKEAENGGGNEKLIEDLPSNRKIVLIKNDKNYGFAEGNNIGIRYSLMKFLPEFIILLNNDTIIGTEIVSDLKQVMDTDASIGIVGPLVYSYDQPEIPQNLGLFYNPFNGHFPTIKKLDADYLDVDYVSGCCLMIRKEVIDRIGLLFSPYFLFFEETDWCIRAKKEGYRIVCSVQSRLLHKGSASVNKLDSPSCIVIYYFSRNKIIFTWRNYSIKTFSIFLLYFSFISIPYTILHLIKKRENHLIYAFLKGVSDGVVFVFKFKNRNPG